MDNTTIIQVGIERRDPDTGHTYNPITIVSAREACDRVGLKALQIEYVDDGVFNLTLPKQHPFVVKLETCDYVEWRMIDASGEMTDSIEAEMP